MRKKGKYNKQSSVIEKLANIVIVLVAVWCLFYRGYIPSKGILPWVYKDKWGGGWKLFAFRVLYVGCELAVIYGVVYGILDRELYNWVWGLLIVALFWMTYDDKNEDDK